MATVRKIFEKPTIYLRRAKHTDSSFSAPVEAHYNSQYSERGGNIHLYSFPGYGIVNNISFDCVIQSSTHISFYIFDSVSVPKPSDFSPYTAKWIKKIDVEPGEQLVSLLEGVEGRYSGSLYIGVFFNQSTDFTINNVTIDCEADNAPPTATITRPTDGLRIRYDQNILFSWDVQSASGVSVVESQLQCSYDPENWGNIAFEQTVGLGRISFYVSPSQFEKSGATIYCRCRSKTNFSDFGAWSGIESFEIYETLPEVSYLSPNGDVYEERREPITLQWMQTIQAGRIIKAELQYSIDSGTTWFPLGIVEDISSYIVPANTFPAAQSSALKWRVRAYNGAEEAGYWGQARLQTAESIPTVSNLKPYATYQNKTKPIALTWSASISDGQIAGSEIEYDLSDGQGWRSLDTITGTDTTYTVPANTFPAVAYTNISQRTGGIRIRVRNKNRDDVFSAWVESSFATIDEIRTAYPISPKRNASQNETKPIIFSCGAYTSYLRDNHTTAFDIRWRRQNGEWSDTIHFDTNITGDTGSYTFSPNTFPVDIIEWQTRAYNQDNIAGVWSQETASFTTVDKPQISTALKPSSTIEDADEPITFRWATLSQSGEASRGADLQYSRDNATWINLGPSVESGPQIPGNVHEYVAPGHTIPPGSIFWRVRSYNRNMVAGDWSAAVSFVAKAAPTVQDIQATAKPWATVIWQADDQQTYEIFVDSESLGSYFGAEKQFPLPDYLEDGVHTVGVRVMGSFSLWSQINETQVTIANTQAAALTLTAETNIDTALTWEGGDGDFFIYRDGLMIAHTNEHSFTDRVSLGTHEYQVIERLASGDYNASETLTQTPAVPYQQIAALAGGDWIAIPHTLKSQSEPSYQESQETAFNYLSGNDYPIASIGSHRTDVGQYSAVLLYTEEAENRAFLALRGKPVILKTADGEVMIGVLNAWERRPKSTREMKLYTAYTFSIQRIGWEDFIDDTL